MRLGVTCQYDTLVGLIRGGGWFPLLFLNVARRRRATDFRSGLFSNYIMWLCYNYNVEMAGLFQVDLDNNI